MVSASAVEEFAAAEELADSEAGFVMAVAGSVS